MNYHSNFESDLRQTTSIEQLGNFFVCLNFKSIKSQLVICSFILKFSVIQSVLEFNFFFWIQLFKLFWFEIFV